MYNNRKRRGAPKDPPVVAMADAKKLIARGKKEAAHGVLFESISYRHRAQFDSTYEDAMKMYIEVGVSILKSCKEGFLQYRSLVQQNHAASLERTINHLVSAVEAAGDREIARIGVDSEQQFESKPLQYQWEAFQVVFTILRNNGKLNHVYCAVVAKALSFCLRLKRTTEFKKLNDTVRRRFGYVINNQQFDYALKINSQDTLNSMLSVRLGMLDGALSMGLHQESFKTIKGLQRNIIDRSYDLKKRIDPELHSAFFEKLAAVFWASNRFLLHSYALFEAFKMLRSHITLKMKGRKNEDSRALSERKLLKLLHEALLAVLIVPAASLNDRSTSSSGNPAMANNRYFTHSLQSLADDYFGRGRRKRVTPSKEGLLRDIMAEAASLRPAKRKMAKTKDDGIDDGNSNGSEQQQSQPLPAKKAPPAEHQSLSNALALYHLMAAKQFNPLTFTQSLSAILRRLQSVEGVDVDFYRRRIHEKGVAMLLRQLSVCYKSISWDRLSALTFPKDELSDIELERIITSSVYYDSTGCTISHSLRLVSFHENHLESELVSDSMVTLNRSLLAIKRSKSLFVEDPSQRQNVYNTIRNAVTAEHKRIDHRLWTIQKQRAEERQLAAERVRAERERERKERAERERLKNEEIAKVAEGKKEIVLREEKEKEKETALRAQSKQWSQLLADIKPSKKKSDGGSYSATAKRPKQSGSKISDLERRQNQIRSVVTQQLRKGEGNETEIARNIERMRRIEDRKKKENAPDREDRVRPLLQSEEALSTEPRSAGNPNPKRTELGPKEEALQSAD